MTSVFNLNSTDQATLTEQHVQEGGSTAFKQFEAYRSLALPPHGHNLWEYIRHESFSYHHMKLIIGRTLDLPPHELNHEEVI